MDLFGLATSTPVGEDPVTVALSSSSSETESSDEEPEYLKALLQHKNNEEEEGKDLQEMQEPQRVSEGSRLVEYAVDEQDEHDGAADENLQDGTLELQTGDEIQENTRAVKRRKIDTDAGEEMASKAPLISPFEAERLVRNTISHPNNYASTSGRAEVTAGGFAAGAYGDSYGESAPAVAYIGTNITRTVACPEKHVRHLIGKGGATIRELQSKSGVARIAVQEHPAPKDQCRTVTIVGTTETVECAVKMLSNLVAVRPGTAEPFGGSRREWTISRRQAGRIIGNAGANIKMIQAQTGAKVQVYQPESALVEGESRGRNQKLIASGTMQAVAAAAKLVQDTIDSCQY
ncbi:hypothetical protein CYMTET_27033 [Cymbomonas tetramitiformis]|uniref:K Homology domain-containing protein n=1 Tax=Cymbomonas tetramitiformis TaxID=36881 RepID=A0AAE0KXD9_9CHLO|nr:hypothetical protein CYMTET_27033 [Cymbomonas tetramitiformis]